MSLWARLKGWFARTGSESLGWVLVPVGILLMPLPGPGTLILVAGVALLSRHYAWARRILDPLKAKAIDAAIYGVRTIPRIAMSVLGGVWLFALGVVWGIGPQIPEFEVLNVGFGPELPAQGWVTGIGLMASAVVAWGLIVYSIKRWRPRGGDVDEASVERAMSDGTADQRSTDQRSTGATSAGQKTAEHLTDDESEGSGRCGRWCRR